MTPSILRLRDFLRQAVRPRRWRRKLPLRKPKRTGPITQQPFRFLSLPAELRLLVYDSLYGHDEVICDTPGLRQLLAIGQINRQIRNEAPSSLYKKRTFVIAAPSLQSFAMHMPPIVCANVTSLRLEEFPNFAMHYLFGGAHSNPATVSLTQGEPLTDVFPALKRLTIRITKNIDKPPQPIQATLDRFFGEVTVGALIEQDSVQWLLRCRQLESFKIIRKRPAKDELARLQGQPFGFLKTLVEAFDGLEADIANAVTRPVDGDGGEATG